MTEQELRKKIKSILFECIRDYESKEPAVNPATNHILALLKESGYVKLADIAKWIDKSFSDDITKAQMMATNFWQAKFNKQAGGK